MDKGIIARGKNAGRVLILAAVLMLYAGIGVSAAEPGRVTGLKAVSGIDATIELSWDRVSGAEGYVVYEMGASQR